MKKLLTLILAFAAVTCYAQDSLPIDINEYARPDFRRSSLDLTPDFNFGAAYKPDRSPKYSSQLHVGGGATMRQVDNSRLMQSSFTLSGSLSLRSNESKQSSGSADVGFSSFTRYFHKEDQFWILQSDIGASFRGISNFDDDFSFDGRVDIGYGFGRVEFVGDAVHMVRLLSMLKEQGVLLKDISTDQLKELIDLVASNKNQRFFDFRLQLIRETEAILDYLSAAGLVSGTDFRTFAILKDAYDFEDAFQGFSTGKTLELTVGRAARYSSDGGWQSAVDLSIAAIYNKYHMLNNYTQSRLYGGVRFDYFRWDRVISVRHRSVIVPQIGYDLTYMPTVRVRFTWSNRLEHIMESEREGTSANDGGRLLFQSSAILSYYVSPEVRFNGNALLRSRTNMGDQSPTFQDEYRFLISAGLLYSIY